MAPCLCFGASPKLVKSTFATERFMAFAISSVSSMPAAPTTMPAIISAGFCSTKPLEADGEAGEGVVDRDDDRHIGAADRQRHQNAEDQREPEEQSDQIGHRDQRIGAAFSREHDIRRRPPA